MESIGSYFQNLPKETRDPNFRRQLLKELYGIYTQPVFENQRRKFKVKAWSEKLFAIKLAHVPTEDFYWLISNVKERREKGIAWLLWSIKNEKENPTNKNLEPKEGR